MKIPLSYLSLLLLGIISLASTCNDLLTGYSNLPYDARVVQFLGDRTVQFLNAADSVKVYALDPLAEAAPESQHLGYALSQQSDTLTNRQRYALHQLLRSEGSYSFDSLQKSCAFLPQYAIAFFGTDSQTQRVDTLSVLLDLNCSVWQFHLADQAPFEDFDRVRDTLGHWLQQLLPMPPPTPPSTPSTEMVLDYLKANFGAKIAERMVAADSISAFLLNPEESSNDSSKLFNGYLIVDRVEQLESPKQQLLLDLLKGKEIKVAGAQLKNCTFLPDVGFRLHVEKEQYTDLLIAFYCDDWLLINANKQVRTDCRLLRPDLLSVARESFPDDAYLRSIPLESE
ncbi:MAG: hypothetical protein AAFW73_11865 [Bacteroidota bacterium]